MVKSVFFGLLAVGLVCLVLGEVPPQKDLSVITRNCLYTMRSMKVDGELQVSGLIYEKSKLAKTDEQSDCIRKDVMKDSLAGVSDALSETIGKILIDLTKAGEKLANGQKEEVDKWIEEFDYDTEKANAKKEYSSKIQNLLKTAEEKTDECLKL